ncbi:hypothetical protein [Mycolicibacterium sarraceniae]|uniref:Uncharacterized protein n=1 Tax=Mycolicibacterium sarraceniae TaxID=1534348 RepID=A0A7I7SN06_9MYCO|nr:hypothetical protein [Mycolicibacterium sarraceniae]BBY58133.1 hypothetical protein MSAR_12690 [Mycolicibacterium sarraceniae]
MLGVELAAAGDEETLLGVELAAAGDEVAAAAWLVAAEALLAAAAAALRELAFPLAEVADVGRAEWAVAFVAVEDAELDCELLDDALSEPEPVPVSAWATAEPLARAAPIPRVTAPAPSHE